MYKKFDLEAAKNGAPVVTRCGNVARVICYDRKNADFPIIALEDNDGDEVCASYTKEGMLFKSRETDSDLFIAPVKKNGWINIYPPGSVNASAYCSEAYVSKAIADHYAKGDRIHCLEIEWPE
jgi:hypothetical protein